MTAGRRAIFVIDEPVAVRTGDRTRAVAVIGDGFVPGRAVGGHAAHERGAALSLRDMVDGIVCVCAYAVDGRRIAESLHRVIISGFIDAVLKRETARAAGCRSLYCLYRVPRLRPASKQNDNDTPRKTLHCRPRIDEFSR